MTKVLGHFTLALGKLAILVLHGGALTKVMYGYTSHKFRVKGLG